MPTIGYIFKFNCIGYILKFKSEIRFNKKKFDFSIINLFDF